MQTEMFEVDPLSDNRKLYVRAAEALAAGALVGIPTETEFLKPREGPPSIP